ncbi:alpha,alpha-trehalase TreF [Psychrosphaera sp. B3R10]|uniref:alpha,alpha-trehalase TreF n=1 Tax=unclassified Psychrosphaera TaxID=2641570 RepID=UPI001C09A158|nr:MULTISPECIES: alpha,alpha-trehalase TreF [unclassified Psychrosphaera]MBU2880526.1 alpha,alpha-trehalase TreF [Psychrosphaera sp. I2R16]MBU2989153.1 alpha,alpha-trehalase TreF [Psychrosphaera sp. B3R10]
MHQTNLNAFNCHESFAFFESELFKDVQTQGVFPDSKTFTDSVPKQPIHKILTNYQQERKSNTGFVLKDFVLANFIIPDTLEITIDSPSTDINQQIEKLWLALEKPADKLTNTSLLPLANPYVVPGGRFREIYYWDSYFSALGLIKSHKTKLVMSMLDNFVDLQRRFDCIPNGNRSYYLSRSQPPILGLLVELLLPFQSEPIPFIKKYIGAITKEYEFWMQGSDDLTDEKSEHRRVVKLPDGSYLNRYWDDSDTPRPESYREDIELLNDFKPDNESEFFRNIRAACESGWDFSSRWLADPQSLATISTTRILPVDLNCLLFKVESLLGHYFEILSDEFLSSQYKDLALKRKIAINRYFWSTKTNYFMDYDLDKKTNSPVLSMAGILPLFVELADEHQAKWISDAIKIQFLKPGGLVTTCVENTQQWDAPNGWAPLHWFAVVGLHNYQHDELANTIKHRWTKTIDVYFKSTGKLMEKYNVCQQTQKAGGGEYDVQEGFGWTNGVYQAMSGED